MTQIPGQAVRAQSFINSIGINVHMEYTDGAYASESNVAQDLAYLGITNIRDMIPDVPAGGIPAADEVSALEALAANGVKMDLLVGATESDIPADIAIVNSLDAATPGSIEAIEGLNEINNNPPSYDGLSGQAAATAEQDAIYAAVQADPTLSGVAVFDFTGGYAPNATPYGSLTENADGSETLVNGITGWLVTLPTGVTTVSITYTGAAPLAGLFGYPGEAQETGLTQGANGALSFTYDNTSGAAMQTYVTASDWNQTTTFTSVSAAPAGSAQNLVDFGTVINLAGQATDANIHPYPAGGATPRGDAASAFRDAYGTATPAAGVVTEAGYDTDPNDANGVSEVAQARGDLDILLDGYASAVSQTYLYELLDEQPDPGNTNAQMHFGLFNNDNSPKLAATAIHDLTSILADESAAASSFTPGTLAWSSTDLPGTAQSLLMEKSSGAFDLAVWNETSLENPVTSFSTIALGATYQTVKIFDPVTGAAPEKTLNDVSQVTLNLGGDPVIVEVEPQLSGASPAPCFLVGTRIATARGEVEVEALAIGDEVRTLSGAPRRVKWLGRRRYVQPFPRNMTDIIPVLIRRGALGPGVPARDLYVSPLHAMYLEDVLVPAGLLVNGRSIRACPEFAEVAYIHVELESHDVIFAEGAATETFVDCDSRGMFENAAEFAALYPADAAPGWAFCAPRVESGQTLRRIWRQVAARAGVAVRRPAMMARCAGHLDHVAPDRIEGWAWLPDFPEEFVELEVLDHDGMIARVVADQHRDDLAQAGIGCGRHAFRLSFASGLAAHKPHEIRVRRAGGGPELAGSPMILPAMSPTILAAMSPTILPAMSPTILAAADTPAGPALLRHQAAGRPPAAAKRALVLDLCWPVPGRDAGSCAILSHIEGLQRLGYEVELAAVDEFAQTPPAALAAQLRCRTAREFAAVEVLLQREGAGYALVYMHRLPVVTRYAGLVRAHCRGADGTGAHLVYGVADLHHVRLERQARIEADASLARFAQATRRHEIAALRQADCVITHSFAEAAYIGRIAPEAHVRVVPWAVPVRPTAARGARDGVLFVGGFDHAPNPDAVRWLLAEILPLVWRAAPHLRCAIAGAGWPRQALPVPGERVRLLGQVEDLEGLYASARLAVAPLRFGAGVKGKVLESFAAGTPCVMSPVAAEGIALTGPLRELVAGDAEHFARLICRLHEDELYNAQAAGAGRAMIAAQFHHGRVLESLRLAAAPRDRAGA
jgi:glycosyltransferase involved in cell wall biosynthesis